MDNPCSDPPRHPLDYIAVSLLFIAVVPFVLANIVLLLNRSYLPIKTKSVDITVLSSIGGLIWIGSTVVTFNHLGRRHGFLAVCPLWSFWLQLCFGFGLWLNSFIVRLINLYRIFILRKRGFTLPVFPLLVMLTPLIIFCIAAQVAGGSTYHEDVKDCRVTTAVGVSILIIFALYFVIFLALAIRLRNIMAQFNEFRIIRYGGVAALLLYLLTIAILRTRTYKQVTGRCFCTLAVALAVFYSFWARNGLVVYKVLFEKAEYAQEFREQLRLHQESGSEVHRRDETAPIPDIPTEAEQVPHTDNMEVVMVELLEELRAQKERVKELEAMLPRAPVEYQQNSTPLHRSAPAVTLAHDNSPLSKLFQGRTWSERLSSFQNAATRITSNSARWSLNSRSSRGNKGVGGAATASNPPSPYESPLPAMAILSNPDNGPELWEVGEGTELGVTPVVKDG